MNEKLMLFYQKKANNYCSSFLKMNGVTKNVVVAIVKIRNQGLAWTDGQAIYINLAHEHFDGMSEEEVYLSVLGLTAHEAAHVIFTDFVLRIRCAKEWRAGVVRSIPANLNNRQADNKSKMDSAMKDKIKRRFITETLLHLDNIIEDGYIEDRCYEVRPGILLDGLEYVRNRHYDLTVPVEKAVSGNSVLMVFYSIVLMYVKYAFIKTTGEANPDSIDLLETTSRCLPYLDKALSSKNSYFRKKMMIGIVLESWEIFEKELEQLPTEEEIEQFLDKLEEMLKEAMSQPGEGQSNSEQVAKDNLISSNTEEADEPESQEEKRERAKKQIQEMMKKAADKTQEESPQEQSEGVGEQDDDEGAQTDGEQSSTDADSGEASDEAGNGDRESKSADGEEDGDQSEADADGGETSDDTDSGESSDETGDGEGEGESADSDSSGSQDQSSSTDNKSGGSDESSSESTGDEGANSDDAASEEDAQKEESIRKALEKLAEEIKEHEEEPEKADEPQKQKCNQKEPLNDLQAEADLIDYGKVHKDIEINVSMQLAGGTSFERRKHMLPSVKKSTQAVVNGLKNFFKNSDKGERQTGLMTGRRVDTRIAHRLDGKIMSAKKEPRPGVAIGVLIDRSGSMSGSRLDTASYTALVFNRMCKELKLNLGVFTHCSNFGVEITCCKNYGETSPQDEQRIMSIEPCGCNRDGAALTYVGERLLKQPEETKMLILVCDGRPADAGYSGDIAKKDLQLIKRKLTRQGVKLVVAAIGEDKEQIKEIYGNSFINISNIETLPKTMVRELVRVLVANQ